MTAPITATGAPKKRRLAPGSKRAAVLRTFIERGAQGMNCFEAVRLCHDYVLRSSVSDLTRLYGINFTRLWEKVPGHAGSKVECVRYWLIGLDLAKARELLGLPDDGSAKRYLSGLAGLLRDLGEDPSGLVRDLEETA